MHEPKSKTEPCARLEWKLPKNVLEELDGLFVLFWKNRSQRDNTPELCSALIIYYISFFTYMSIEVHFIFGK